MTHLDITIRIELSEEMSELLHRLIDAIERHEDDDDDKNEDNDIYSEDNFAP